MSTSNCTSSSIITFALTVTCFILAIKNHNLRIENTAHRFKKQRKRQRKTTNTTDHDDDDDMSNTTATSTNRNCSRCISNSSSDIKENSVPSFTMTEIGIISSPFPQRAGTPRQGLLANQVRSILTLHSHVVPKETLDDLEQYSHVWIIFQFHLNPVGKAKDKKSEGKKLIFNASKVCPPRAHGKKVGVFATRSPHRPNNVGLSVAKIESITTETSLVECGGGVTKERKRTVIHLLGLDLVDQTPVYDIKPYLKTDAIDDQDIINPDWVTSQDDKLASVQWKEEAKNNLYLLQKKGLLAPFYPSKNADEDKAYNAISQVIAQDPRAQHEGRGKESNALSFYEITFCRTRVSFSIQKDNNNETDGKARGNNQYALIMNILEDEGDLEAARGSYQYKVAKSSKDDKK